MHREGHIGLGLLMYAPFAFVTAYYELYVTCLLGAVAIQYWSHFPDIDITLSFLTHRGITHTFGAAVAAGLVTATAGVGLLTTDVLPATLFASDAVGVPTVVLVGGYGFLIGFLGVNSHILGDAFTPMGVQPVVPLSDAEFSLSLFRAANETANRAFAKAGLYAFGGAFVLGIMLRIGVLQDIWTQFGEIAQTI